MWGSALFQSIYHPPPRLLGSFSEMPEWYLLIGALAALSGLGIAWTPMLTALPLLALAVTAVLAQAVASSVRSPFPASTSARTTRLMLVLLTAFLHLLQPAARLTGRLSHGLTPWRRRGRRGRLQLRPRTWTLWNERPKPPEERIRGLEATLQAEGRRVLRGGDFDRWDLEASGGLLAGARFRMAVEEHAGGAQLVRLRSWPHWSQVGRRATMLFGALAVLAGADRAWVACALLAAFTLALVISAVWEYAVAAGALSRVTEQSEEQKRDASSRPRDLKASEVKET
jgi:hypothetical protein